MSLIRLHRNPKGKAFKKLFEYIKKKFPDKEFQRKDMPEVPKDYLNEVKMQTAGTYWIDSSPSICAIETLLIDMCNNELLQKREVQRNQWGDMDIFFSLTTKGKQSEVAYG